MSKRNGVSKAAPAAPAAGTAANLAARALPDKALDFGKQQPDVIEWDGGNGQSVFQASQLPPEPTGEAGADDGAAAGDQASAAAGEKTPPAKTESEGDQGDGGDQGGTVSLPAAAAPPAKPKGSAARSAAFQALDAERARVTLEQQARTNADRATAAETELARIKKLPLKEQLKYLGVDRETLAETVLVGGDDVADLPEKATGAKTSPEIEELRAEVQALKADKAARGATEVQQAISAGHQVVAEALKEVATVPMVKGVRDVLVDGQYVHSGIDLTLKTAHQAWLQAGRAGHPRDYVAGAAEVVEAYLREKRPDIAAYMVTAPAGAGGAKTGQQDPPATRGTGGPASIGKRTGARPDAQERELPMDRHQRDQQIKREMGWS